jgi:hypothetical protein
VLGAVEAVGELEKLRGADGAECSSASVDLEGTGGDVPEFAAPANDVGG